MTSMGEAVTPAGRVISRVLMPDEVNRLATAIRKVAGLRVVIPVLASVVVLFALGGIVLRADPASVVIVCGSLVIIMAAASAVGWFIGLTIGREQERFKLGQSGVLTVRWNTGGGHISSENFSRVVWYQEVLEMRQVDGVFVLRLRISTANLAVPYVVGLPVDFVPSEVLQHLASIGAKIR